MLVFLQSKTNLRKKDFVISKRPIQRKTCFSDVGLPICLQLYSRRKQWRNWGCVIAPPLKKILFILKEHKDKIILLCSPRFVEKCYYVFILFPVIENFYSILVENIRTNCYENLYQIIRRMLSQCISQHSSLVSSCST